MITSFENTLSTINSLVDKEIIVKYAIGGGIACLYYIEPTNTYDLDIMIILSSEKNVLDPLRPLFRFMRKSK